MGVLVGLVREVTVVEWGGKRRRSEVLVDLPERKEPVIRPSWAPVRADIFGW